MLGAKRGLRPTTYDDWVSSAESISSRRSPGPLLAWAQTHDGLCIVSRGFLSVQQPQNESGEDRLVQRWHHLGWHEVERGSFDADQRRLSWTTYTSGPGTVSLPEPGRVPDVFRERVAASIAVEEFIPLENGGDTRRGVIVNGRRDLSCPDAAIIWHASLPNGVTWDTPGVGELADAAVARLRAEYDPQG